MNAKYILFTAPVLLALSTAGFAQTSEDPAAALAPDSTIFAPENAVLDTSIPFAIGAREAQQELRSAYGWPTFQEGLVDGVYFRLDPDGYARFSPTPRLDADIFEVICQPRTTSCTGRKGELSMYLGTTGLIELKIEGVAPGDTFFIVDNQIETPLPERILMPLDAPLETLLGFGGELIVRRGAAESARFSLKGFRPVAAYLRWIAADQNYTVLPRDWPVPGSRTLTETTDVVDLRLSAMPTPTPALPAMPVAGAEVAMMPSPAPSGPIVDGVTLSQVQYSELLLRILTVEAQLAQMHATAAVPLPANTEVAAAPATPEVNPDLEKLQYLTSVMGLDEKTAKMVLQLPATVATPAAVAPSAASPTEDAKLQYLMSVMGMDEKTAIMVLQLPTAVATPATVAPSAASPTEDAKLQYLMSVVGMDEKTAMMVLQLPTAVATPAAATEIATEVPATSSTEYVALSAYLNAVAAALPQQ